MFSVFLRDTAKLLLFRRGARGTSAPSNVRQAARRTRHDLPTHRRDAGRQHASCTFTVVTLRAGHHRREEKEPMAAHGPNKRTRNTNALAMVAGALLALIAVLAFLALISHLAGAQVTLGAQAPGISILPARPAPGAIVHVIVTTTPRAGDSVVAVSGTVAGEQLHFARSARGRYQAIGAVPVDSARTTAAAIVAFRSGRADTVQSEIALPPLPPPTEKLDVASRFGQPLDSALEARVAREVDIAHEVGRRSHETPRLWTAPFTRPRPSAITSRFGAGRTFNGRVTSRHLGVDFRGAAGAPVRAANRGVVAAIDTFYLGGRIVYLDHGEGIVTAYMHLSKFLVAVGDTVARGQRIGLVGATGRVTGPHLHWAARYGSLTVNPLDLLGLTAPRPR
jgi:murein DD-endopeptidase MepM/ murein hydrolase activator NlpD